MTHLNHLKTVGVDNATISFDIMHDDIPELDEVIEVILYNVTGRNERLRTGAVSITQWEKSPVCKTALLQTAFSAILPTGYTHS